MGTYIYTCAETLTDSGWVANTAEIFTADPTWPGMEGQAFTHLPFFSQNYALFALLVGYQEVPGITALGKPRSLPTDASDHALHELVGMYETSMWDDPDEVLTVDERIRRRVNVDRGGYSWICIDELLAVDYDQVVEAATEHAPAVLLRDALGSLCMRHLQQIQSLGAPAKTRLLFCFDC